LVLLVLLATESYLASSAGLGEHPGLAVWRSAELWGASICLIVATLWTGFRGHPALFPSVHGNRPENPSLSLLRLARWLLWMRWLACAIGTIVVLHSIEVFHLLDQDLLTPILACLLVLAVANLAFERWLELQPQKVDRQVRVQMATDLILLTAMIHFSGGVENPLSLLYLCHVIISGILLSRRTCYLVATISFFLFAGTVGLEYQDWIRHYDLKLLPHSLIANQIPHRFHPAHFPPYVVSRLLLQLVFLVIVGYFITTIMGRLRSQERAARDLAHRESESRKRLESVVETAGAGLRLLDENLRPLWTNQRFRDWNRESARTLETAAATLKDGRTRITKHYHQVVGRSSFFEMATTAMLDQDGIPYRVVQLLQDVSAQRAAEAEALRSAKLAVVGKVASSIGHEIINPVSILAGRLRLLLKRRSEEGKDLRTELQTMIELTDRITTIIRTMLGHVRAGKDRHEAIRLDEIFENTMLLVDSAAQRKGVAVHPLFEANVPPVCGQPAEIEQVMLNLVLNAIDASPKGSEIEIEGRTVRAQDGHCWLQLSVEDSGPGVPPPLREQIFEPFFTTKRNGEGTGLGLSICRRIVEEHGGRIRVTDGRVGARFEMELPCAAAEEVLGT